MTEKLYLLKFILKGFFPILYTCRDFELYTLNMLNICGLLLWGTADS